MSESSARGSVAPGIEVEAAAGLYLHVPFCSSICPYCDFAVLKGDRRRRASFVDSLVAEIRLYEDYPARFDTVYFGGGTPSMLTSRELSEILDALHRHLEVDPEAQVSMEVNPEDVDDRSLRAWRRLGVEALSLGIQSLDDRELSFLGRVHDGSTARRSVAAAQAAGFRTVSLDLIYGLPNQSLSAWRRGLDSVLELEPDHLSCYQLTVHEKTVFGVKRRRGQFSELPEEHQAELFFTTHEVLGAAGYQGYEASNFARGPEHFSRHNRKYWDHTPYLGLGPSAHSFKGRQRWWNERKEITWSKSIQRNLPPVAGREELSGSELALERLMLGFRTSDGVDLGEVRRRYAVDLEPSNARLITELEREDKLMRVGDRLVPTLAGIALADSMARAFELPDDDREG